MSYLSYEYPTFSYYSIPTSNPLLQTYLLLQILGGLVLLPLLLFTFLFSKSTPRDATLNNLLFCFILVALGSSLSVFTEDPAHLMDSQRWCVAQSILIHSSLPMAGTASCALVVNLWFNVYLAIYQPKWGSSWRKWRNSILLAPYVVGAAFAVAAGLMAALFPAGVSRGMRAFNCTFTGRGFFNATLLCTGSILMIQMFLQLVASTIIFRHWRIIRTYQYNMSSACIRISIFSAWVALSGASALISVWVPSSPVPGMIYATNPLAAFLVFGTQRDVISVWQFWRVGNPRFVQLSEEPEKSERISNFRRHSV